MDDEGVGQLAGMVDWALTALLVRISPTQVEPRHHGQRIIPLQACAADSDEFSSGRIVKYDEVDQHLLDIETEFEGMARACGTHIGFYVTWLAMQSMLAANLAPQAEAIRQRKLTGRELLMAKCDDKLLDSDLNARGNAFTLSYYSPTRFHADYARVFGIAEDPPEAFFQVEDSWANYDRLAAVLDARLREADELAARPGKKELLRDMEAAFRPVLEGLGFQRSRTWLDENAGVFEVGGPWGEHRIALYAVDRPGFVFGLQVVVSSRLLDLAQVLREDLVQDYERISAEPPATTNLRLENWFGTDRSLLQPWPRDPNILEVNDRSRSARLVAALGQTAAVTLPLLLRPLQTLQGYNAVYNTQPRSASRYFSGYLDRAPLLCAEMVGNPRLLDLCRETEAALAAQAPGPEHSAEQGHSMRQCIGRIRARAAGRRSD
jgi:hypothetical protein